MEWNLWPVINFTVWQSVIVTIVSVGLGGALALYERAQYASTPSWFLISCALPLFLPPLIVGTGFIQLLGQAGDLNTLFHWLGLETIQWLYRPTAVVLAHLYYNLPLAYLAIRASLHSSSRHTEESARVLGASTMEIVHTIWWPQLKPTIYGISIIIGLYCWTSFALPLQLGGSQAKTIEVWLYEQITLYHHTALAIGVAAIQTLVWLLLIGLLLKLRPNFVSSFHPAILTSKRHLTVLQALLACLWLSPLISLVVHTLLHVKSVTFTNLLTSQFPLALGRSIVLTTVVTLVTLGVSFILRISSGWTTLLLTLSPVTIGLVWSLWIGQSLISLGLALVLGLLPLAHYLITQSRANMPNDLWDTARLLGASYWQQLWLEMQWLKPTARQIAVVGLVFVLGDMALASLLTPYHQPTAMQVAYGLLGSYRFQMGSLALLIILVLIFSVQSLLYAHRPKS